MKAEGHKLLAGSGWLRVDSTDAVTTAHYGVVVREDTVIAVWTSEGGTRDLVAYFGISGKTITTSDPALIIPDAMIKGGAQNFQLTSGSVNLLRT